MDEFKNPTVTIICPNGSVLTEVEEVAGISTCRTRYDITGLTFPRGTYQIQRESGTEEMKNAKIVITDVFKKSKEYYFTFEILSKDDLRYAQNRSDIEYIAMMSDVDLEG